MRTYDLGHLSDSEVLDGLALRSRRDKTNTAEYVAHIAEVEARRLYAPAGFPSMFEYCIRVLHLSEQAALKRIRAGRVARRHPAFFAALADGRLHLSAILVMKPYLTRKNANGLIAEAEHKTRAEIEMLLARRFPKADVPTRLQAISEPPTLELSTGTPGSDSDQLAPGLVESAPHQLSPGTPAPTPARVTPLAPQRFALQVTLDQEAHDLLRRVQELSSHELPSGEILEILKQALRARVRELQQRKFAATDKPRASRRASTNTRGIPAHVRREVSQRDQNQCTFVSETGHRCGARKFIEFDHIQPVAHGGPSTVQNLRLRCRAHNQYEAEKNFGAGFMEQKRDAQDEHTRDIIAGLRELGFRADQARRAAQESETSVDMSLEDRMRAALKLLCPRTGVRHEPAPTLGMPAD